MRLVPRFRDEAFLFCRLIHRHHPAPHGYVWALGAEKEGRTVGVAILGRPSSPGFNPKETIEITRVATDGTRNACSFLYGAARDSAFAHGFVHVITYTLASESGTSLRAAGFKEEARVKGRSWDRPKRRRADKHPTVDKIRWGSRRAA